MENKSLSDKRFQNMECPSSNQYDYSEEDVKEKVQNAHKRLKHDLEMDCQAGYINDEQCEFRELIDKIFKEEFGEKLTNGK